MVSDMVLGGYMGDRWHEMFRDLDLTLQKLNECSPQSSWIF